MDPSSITMCPYQGNNPLFQQLKTTIDNYPYQDFDPYYSIVSRIMKRLLSRDGLQQNEIDGLTASLKLIRETRILPILVELNYALVLIKLVEHPQTPEQIKVAALNTVESVCKQTCLKKKILNDRLMLLLFKIAL